MPEIYKVKVNCLNCEWHGEVDIPKGTRVDQMECPNCGCKELDKDLE